MRSAVSAFLAGLLMALPGTAALAELLTPRITGTPYAGVEHLRVESLRPGTAIAVLALDPDNPTLPPKRIGNAIATSGLALLRVSPALVAGQDVRVEVSEPGAPDVTLHDIARVVPAPDPVPRPAAKLGPRITGGAECVKLKDLVPMSGVAVFASPGGERLGRAIADPRGEAELFFTRPIGPGDTPVLQSELAPNAATPPGAVAIADYAYRKPPAEAEKLRAPRLTGPIPACRTAFSSTDHEPGALFWIKRTGFFEQPYLGPRCATEPDVSGRFPDRTETSWGKLYAEQEMPALGLASRFNEAHFIDIDPEARPARPKGAPMTAPARDVRLSGRVPSAQLFFEHRRPGLPEPLEANDLPADSSVIRLTTAARAGDTVTVWQVACGLESARETITVGAQRLQPGPILPVDPVYACAASVELQGVAGDTRVIGFARNAAGTVTPITGFGDPARHEGVGQTFIRPDYALDPAWEIAAWQGYGDAPGPSVSDKIADDGWVRVRALPEDAPRVLQPSDASLAALQTGTPGGLAAVHLCTPLALPDLLKGAAVTPVVDGYVKPVRIHRASRLALSPAALGAVPGQTLSLRQSFCSRSSPEAPAPVRVVGKVWFEGPAIDAPLRIETAPRPFDLRLATGCPVPHDVTFMLRLDNPNVLEFVDPVTGAGVSERSVTLTAGQGETTLRLRAIGPGKARLGVTNRTDIAYVPVDRTTRAHDPANAETELSVIGWVQRTAPVTLTSRAGHPQAVSGTLKGNPPLTATDHIRITAISHGTDALELNIKDGPGPSGNPCAAATILQLGGFASGGTAATSGIIPPADRPSSKTIHACGSGGPAPPWDILVTYDQEIGAP